jgi:hypothetical protein
MRQPTLPDTLLLSNSTVRLGVVLSHIRYAFGSYIAVSMKFNFIRNFELKNS